MDTTIATTESVVRHAESRMRLFLTSDRIEQP